MADLAEGEVAPAFKAKDTHGNTVRLADFKGRFVVLYFYPKDDTPGCTIEACAFRDDYEKFKMKGVAVLGVSMDSQESHRKFVDKYHLPFPLLLDENAAISKAYGAYGEKNFLGIKSMGVKRKTFLIGKDGRLARVWNKVLPLGHSRDVLKAIESLE